MTAPTTSAAAQAYLAAVESELADLPVEDRAELLEDLALHLAAIELEPEERPLEARLGSSTDYAFELRAAAGLPARQQVRRATKLAPQLAAAMALGRSGVQEVRAFVPQLAPAWWLLRGYLVVLLPSLWHVSGSRDFPVPAPWGSHVLGVVLVAAAMVTSVALGRRRVPRVAAVVGNAVVALAAVTLLASAPSRLAVHDYRVLVAGRSVSAESPLISPHGPVTDVLPYTADGKPLHDVLLFDQDGRPLRVGQQLWWADRCRRVLAQPRAADGVPVPFSYPQQYVLDPAGRSLSGAHITPGQCRAVLQRPEVPIPVRPTPARTPAPVSR